MIFEIDNIELYFSEKQILNGVYLKAETGKITGILGSNGCGKSSLLNIFFGSLQARHQLIRVDKKPFLKPLFKYGIVKYLPQQNFIPPKLKIQQIFDLFKIDWQEFILNFPEFKSYLKHRIRDLSGGEQRVIEIYTCLKSESQLVLLDEPFSHLSPIFIDKIKALLVTEKRHKAIIITDHMYRHILEVSEELYLLKNGSTQLNQEPRGKPTRYELENTFQKLRGKPRGIKPSGGIKNNKALEDYSYLQEGTL